MCVCVRALILSIRNATSGLQRAGSHIICVLKSALSNLLALCSSQAVLCTVTATRIGVSWTWSKSKPKCLKVNVKTRNRCINIRIVLWQHIPVLLDHLQASSKIYGVQSVQIMYCGIPYYLQGVRVHEINLSL